MSSMLSEGERTCMCGEVREGHVGQEITLYGWVSSQRDLGAMVFVDLRDRTGIVQLRFEPDIDPGAFDSAGALRAEWCIAIRGEVSRRAASRDGKANANAEMATGALEVKVRRIEVLSEADPTPFVIRDDPDASEATRLEYRYLGSAPRAGPARADPALEGERAGPK